MMGCGKTQREAGSSTNVDEQIAIEKLEAVGNSTEDRSSLYLVSTGSLMN